VDAPASRRAAFAPINSRDPAAGESGYGSERSLVVSRSPVQRFLEYGEQVLDVTGALLVKRGCVGAHLVDV
jgi:hypothetical protein